MGVLFLNICIFQDEKWIYLLRNRTSADFYAKKKVITVISQKVELIPAINNQKAVTINLLKNLSDFASELVSRFFHNFLII